MKIEIPELNFHRLFWNSEHFNTAGELDHSTIRKGDLAPGGGFSVDRCDLATRSKCIQTVKLQKQKHQPPEFDRTIAMSALLVCSEIHEKMDSKGVTPFEVLESKIDENDAHCIITNITGDKGRSYINELRTMIVELCHSIVGFDIRFPPKLG